MKLIAIDPSLTSTGFAFRGDDGHIEVGTIRPKNMTGPERLLYIERQLAHILDTVAPDAVAYEDYAMRSKGKVFHIGELGGVLKVHLWRRGVDIILVPPSNLKLFVTGKGNPGKGKEAKTLLMQILARHRGRLFNNSDEADAYGLLLAGEAFCNRRLLPRDRRHHQSVAVRGFSFIEGKR